jgi:hypothetical protein
MGFLSDTGLPPDGFDQPQPQVFFGVRDDNMALFMSVYGTHINGHSCK